MANSKPFLDAVEARASIYKITNSSPIPDARIHEIVTFAIQHCPSSWNVQSARAVILLKGEHEKLWDIAADVMATAVPEAVYTSHIGPRVRGFRGGYGSVMFFEDQADVEELAAKNPMVASVIPEWSDHASGMHQFTVWTALEAEGMGCNLQHYNFSPEFCTRVAAQWNIPASWKLKSQLVFGTPTGGRNFPRTYKPLEDRVKVFSS